MWELIITSLINILIIGGGITAYHLYTEYKRKQYMEKLYRELGSLIPLSVNILHYIWSNPSYNTFDIFKIVMEDPVIKANLNIQNIDVVPENVNNNPSNSNNLY